MYFPENMNADIKLGKKNPLFSYSSSCGIDLIFPILDNFSPEQLLDLLRVFHPFPKARKVTIESYGGKWSDEIGLTAGKSGVCFCLCCTLWQNGETFCLGKYSGCLQIKLFSVLQSWYFYPDGFQRYWHGPCLQLGPSPYVWFYCDNFHFFGFCCESLLWWLNVVGDLGRGESLISLMHENFNYENLSL